MAKPVELYLLPLTGHLMLGHNYVGSEGVAILSVTVMSSKCHIFYNSRIYIRLGNSSRAYNNHLNLINIYAGHLRRIRLHGRICGLTKLDSA